MRKIVFTNGCFDLIHPGHLDLLKKARSLGTELVVGINSDESVRAIKGKERPFLDEISRAEILKSLRYVDEVFVFDENTPERLIKEIKPDVLVKGGDWSIEQIIGADFVLKNGGEVFSIPFEKDFSTSKIAEKIKNADLIQSETTLKSTDKLIVIKKSIEDYPGIFRDVLNSEFSSILKCSEIILETLKNGNKIAISSTGIDKHFRDFLASKFVLDRNYDEVNFNSNFEQSAVNGDLLIAINEKGSSESVLSIIMKARETGCLTIGLTGHGGKRLASLCDASVLIKVEESFEFEAITVAIVNIWRKYSENYLNESSNR